MSQSGIYSELKMAWHYSREDKLPDAPKQVQLILSDLCNQDCSFCAYRMSGYTSNELFVGDSEKSKYGHNNPKRFIPTQRALRLLLEMRKAGVEAIQMTGGGEPTVHPDHEDIFTFALATDFRCSLVSNGVKWSYNLIENILPRFDWVRVSIDAGNSESYAKIRRTPPDNFHKVWIQVNHLSHIIARDKRPTVLGVGFVVTPDNCGEILEFAKRAKDSGAHNARFSAMFSPENEKPYEDIWKSITYEIAKAKRIYNAPNFQIHDNFGSRLEDLEQHSPDYSFCSYQHYTSYIGGDLQAYRCCVLAYNERGKIKGGDLTTRDFGEFWDSNDRTRDFAKFDAKGCERCQFNEKNRAMNYLLQPDP
ncbi:hypothetical protein LCGC14_1763970, partial [marine sediment metagenome]